MLRRTSALQHLHGGSSSGMGTGGCYTSCRQPLSCSLLAGPCNCPWLTRKIASRSTSVDPAVSIGSSAIASDQRPSSTEAWKRLTWGGCICTPYDCVGLTCDYVGHAWGGCICTPCDCAGSWQRLCVQDCHMGRLHLPTL